MHAQEHGKAGPVTTPTTAPATTLDPTQEGARGQAAELLPEGGGEGVRRMFTWSGEVEVRPGVTETVYLGKYYWQHLPAGRLDEYQRHAQTPNGWFRITKTQYEIQHGATNRHGEVTRRAHPEAWTTVLAGGTDGAVVRTPIEFLNEHRRDPEGGGTFALTSQTDCDVELVLDQPLSADADVVLEALGTDDVQRTLATLHVPAGQTVAQGHYTLLPGEALRVRFLGSETTGVTLSGITRVRLGEGGPFAPDTLDLYGTEVPQAVDLDAIATLLR
ncbi:MAG: hypothetical protein R3F60_33490 [bacterium]